MDKELQYYYCPKRIVKLCLKLEGKNLECELNSYENVKENGT